MPFTIKLTVEIEAPDEETARGMLDSLARMACDIANSTADDDTHITITEEGV